MRGLLWPRKDMGLASLYRTAVMRDGPVGYWRLSDTGSTAVAEVGPSGTYIANARWGIPGAIADDANMAAETTAGADRVDVAGFSVPTAAITIEVWMYPIGIADQIFIRVGDSPNHLRMFVAGEPRLSLNLSGIQRWLGDAGTTAIARPRQNAWHYIVGTYDGAAMNLYLNGRPAVAPAAFTGAVVGGSVTVQIGNWSLGSFDFVGRMDEVAIYDYALTPAQILNHYRLGAGWAAVASPQSWITGALHPADDPIIGTRWRPITVRA